MAREQFEMFWDAYPKRPNNPKHPAWQVWEKLEKADLPAPVQMVVAAQRYGDYCKAEKIEPKFIAHARTWLHQRRWEEFLAEPEAPKEPELSALLKQLVPIVGVGWVKSREMYLQDVTDDGNVVVIRTRDRFRIDRIELDANVIARALKRDVRVEYRP